MRDLGRTLTAVTGWSPFSGPIGWLLSGLSLLAAMMILLALVTGRSGGRFRRSVSGG